MADNRTIQCQMGFCSTCPAPGVCDCPCHQEDEILELLDLAEEAHDAAGEAWQEATYGPFNTGPGGA